MLHPLRDSPSLQVRGQKTSAMPSRRSHKKSRHGCLQCKNRRVKCSETRPQCEQCGNRRLLCHYSSNALLWPDVSLKSRSSTPPKSSSSASSSSSESHSISAGTVPRRNDLMDAVSLLPRDEALRLDDLELMMNWCTSTYRCLARDSAGEAVWQTVVPREALHHPFLMHGILALSALHLAFTSSESQRKVYLKTAQAHQTQAIAGLTPVVGNLNRSNCNATFALSSTMIIFAFGFPLLVGPEEDCSPLGDLCQVISLTRGPMKVLMEIIDWVQDGEMAPLIKKHDSDPKMPNTSQLAMLSLKRLNTTLASRDPQHETEIYLETIDQLGDCLGELVRGSEPGLVAFFWIFRIPERYVDLLRAREPLALAILAHYCVIMYNLRDRWWMGDWGTKVLKEICQLLGREWRQSISWAIDATGLCVPGT